MTFPSIFRLSPRSALLLGLLVIATGCAVPNSVLIRRGEQAMQAGQLDRADHFLSRALRQDRIDWLAHYRMGLLRLRQGRPLDAQLSLEKALTLHAREPETGEVIDALAESLLIQEKKTELLGLLEQSINDYGKVEDYLRQARFMTRMGDVDGATLALRKSALAADPLDPTPYQAMFEFYDSIDDSANAMIALRHLYYFMPLDPVVAAHLRKYGIVPGPTVALEPLSKNNP
ncbi:MAG: hypothetical protein IT443_00340 [Phycisphaeraceae bacterium]|nr:hypothetical protein [Phycisphaeraceae bacterium]